MVRTRYGELVRVYRQQSLDPLEKVDNEDEEDESQQE